jgi:hypothetical protein
VTRTPARPAVPGTDRLAPRLLHGRHWQALHPTGRGLARPVADHYLLRLFVTDPAGVPSRPRQPPAHL